MTVFVLLAGIFTRLTTLSSSKSSAEVATPVVIWLALLVASLAAFVSSVSENAYSPEPVAKALLEMLSGNGFVKEYYKTEELTLENIALKRNWILKAEQPDTERTAIYVLKDFREGRLGLFILDEIPQ